MGINLSLAPASCGLVNGALACKISCNIFLQNLHCSKREASMSHLSSFRIGWENERLALFLLSRISFVAHPSSVGDDVGSDFFCTLFEREQVNSKEMLIARNSFAIQVKSNHEVFDVTNKLEYLKKLELPFFVGVVDQKGLSLAIYSGEYLPILFVHPKPTMRLHLAPVNEAVPIHAYYESQSDGDYILKMPHILTLTASEGQQTLEDNGSQLRTLCSRLHENISTVTNKEYIFKLESSPEAYILAGPGSNQTFRYNFYLRLAEVFYNLQWLEEHGRLDRQEFEVFQRCYSDISAIRKDIPPVVGERLRELKKLLNIAE
jgi:hypothetical protein